MKSARMHEHGDADELFYEDAPIPEINDGQILVRVHATSVNHLEMLVASGGRKENFPVEFPWIPGYDLSGVVEKTGSRVSSFRPGDEVFAKCVGGSYAEYIALDESYAAHKPANMSFSEAASIPHVGLTAWQALFEHAKLKSGMRVLVHGGAGAVGSLAVSFAKNAGAFIYATASNGDLDYVKSLGADVIIDYKKQDFAQIAKDIDIALILVGGDTQAKTFPVMKRGGIMVSTTGPVDEAMAEKAGVTGTAMVVHPDGAELEEISKLAESGKIEADVALEYPLSEAAEAWRVFTHVNPAPKKFTHGKIVLTM